MTTRSIQKEIAEHKAAGLCWHQTRVDYQLTKLCDREADPSSKNHLCPHHDEPKWSCDIGGGNSCGNQAVVHYKFTDVDRKDQQRCSEHAGQEH